MTLRSLVLALAAATLAALALALPAAARTSTDTTTSRSAVEFVDPAGDAKGAPDITDLQVSTTQDGIATFRVVVPVLATDTTSLIGVAIDADNNTATGDPNWGGADYEIDSYQDTHSYSIERWNATTSAWDDDAAASTVDVSWDSSGIDFSINRSELGNASKVGVFAFSYASFESPDDAQSDVAPNTGAVSFDLSPMQLKPVLWRATPAKAGAQFGLVLVARRSDTGDYVTGGSGATLACTATGGGRRIVTLFSGFLTAKQIPVGTCAWKLAPGLKTKVVHATITVKLNGATVTRTIAVKVR